VGTKRSRQTTSSVLLAPPILRGSRSCHGAAAHSSGLADRRAGAGGRHAPEVASAFRRTVSLAPSASMNSILGFTAREGVDSAVGTASTRSVKECSCCFSNRRLPRDPRSGKITYRVLGLISILAAPCQSASSSRPHDNLFPRHGQTEGAPDRTLLLSIEAILVTHLFVSAVLRATFLGD
jgi:hypothetical protein